MSRDFVHKSSTVCGTQAPPGAEAHTVYFREFYIVCDENKIRIKEMECEKK